MIQTAILGASGYTGAELIRLLYNRSDIRIAALTAERNAGAAACDVWPHLRGLDLPVLCKIGEVDFSNIDFVFCALPHGTTQDVIAALPDHVRIVDLSADFRLADTAAYETWYGQPHRAPSLQTGAVYGLTELNRDAIRAARLVANPGCYPTAAQLALIPLIRAGAIAADDIIIDAKSGISGAGRDPKRGSLLCEASENFEAYNIAKHRHTPEIEQGLAAAAGHDVRVNFTPHLVPMMRGIFETMYVRLTPGSSVDRLRAIWADTYRGASFVRVLPPDALPATRHVRGTNLCDIAVQADRLSGRAVVVAAIDNIVKGASGQAVQNMNVMLGLPEDEGLRLIAPWP